MNTENFRDIPNCFPYQVNNVGEIRNNKSGRILKQVAEYRTSTKGVITPWRLRVNLKVNKKSLCFNVHNLVAALFLEKPVSNFSLTVDHRDRNPFNNDVNNLRYATRKEQSMNRHATINRISRKFTMDDINTMYEQSKTLSFAQMATLHGVDRGTIHKLLLHMHPDY